MALACTVLPMPKEARVAKSAKRMASHFQPKPFSRAYIGPPSIFPRLVFTRYFTASKPSAYLVEIPNTPVSQHQSTAWTSQGNGCGHTDDVTCTNGSGKGSSQATKLGYISRGILVFLY